MDENSGAVDIPKSNTNNEDHGWKTVTYHKKNKKQPQQNKNARSASAAAGEGVSSDRRNDVFRLIEQNSDERHRKWVESQRAAAISTGDFSAVAVDDGDDDGSDVDGAAVAENGVAPTEEKKIKPKKPKKPKISVPEAASKIDSSDLAAFLAEISVSYETQQDIQLMRFADYFGRAFSKVSGSQFPWMKLLKESSVAKMVDIPVVNVSEGVYKTSTDWLNQRSIDALGPFVLWGLDSILSDLALHLGGAKGAKKVVQQASSKSQVAIFLVLAMILRRKPDVLISVWPDLKENPKYQGQDKLPVLVWAVTQALQGDLAVGLFVWVRLLFPLLTSKSGSSPQSRDLILQVVERIISFPKARTILVNGAARKGERVVPGSSLEDLMRATFPATTSRGKVTERFEAIYPVLKEVALFISPGSKAAKQISQQIMHFAIKAAGEGIPDLAKEASDLFIWCLTVNPDSYKQWDYIYLDNLEANVIILKKLSDEWKVQSANHSTLEPLKTSLKSFIVKVSVLISII
ncbi:OLC1v1011595C3 [Oldenlandia corymbosa var. corymbosa]|uniref:OLC1v1011595C3 n=1 Tax=Oldenlandia corymbosa var. corymbosa TaxID=529605 RepID=A0AAV1DXB1_OLDCO|nr:OLC1v1011595C3 [Oldenlandia corymbosa var. corymbosa]